ncbi:MAG: hypothetical protein MUD01_18350 [Chloroflexaceae bacterium]|jgi:hypothetical protein|nr:hypothetical protein [Chloroflexaceae bacterium]
MTGPFTESIGPITPLFLCWACLILAVAGLIVAGYYTNITAFARRTREGKKPEAGSTSRAEKRM